MTRDNVNDLGNKNHKLKVMVSHYFFDMFTGEASSPPG